MEEFTEEVVVQRTISSLVKQYGSLDKGIDEIVGKGFELFQQTPRFLYFRRFVYFV